MAQLIILIALFALLWVLLIRPQRVRQQKQQQLLSSIEPGDEVLTVGGLYGIVQEIDEEDDLVVEIADGIHVRIARRAVGGVVKPEDEEDDELEELAELDELEAAADEETAEAELVAVEDEEGVKDSKDLVSTEAADGPTGAERR